MAISVDILKIIAILSMFIDHLGFYVNEDLRVLGRVAVVLFLVLLAYNTTKKFYIERLLFFHTFFILA